MSVIAEIKFNGETIGLKYTIPALRMIFQKLDRLSFLAAETYDDVSIAQIVYSGQVVYSISKQLVPRFKFEEVYDSILMNDVEELRKAVAAFTEGCKSLYTDAVPDEKKSQSTGKKLKKQPMGNSV